ncbi:response regulator [Deinococcus peraridilitoris]|uniref:Response regulator containing a CheY-like receiver domain and an HTH DNA-binding domain protein n=1 Tax=Deinococcus peraridilitoris (strain DSM 19664 / LMG 22246 / CIP 109416 / KR-200) TaxID=937777 RepID=L0A912_DEIPD|nr:response regulator [Deinococcus peraridilitoris]AFZ69607.1 response regulator containing a CheY-like receiver domain and an HTH DNA-binding domain protein [Deinococcus peraridilitoris DSM 19664]
MCQILLVEDNPLDVEFIRETLMQFPVSVTLHVARDGAEALDFLRNDGERQGPPRPDLILLDLRLPRRDGFEVLEVIKTHPLDRNIPVVVLTISNEEADAWRSYHLYANAFITKPADLQRFTETLHATVEFYCHVTLRPPKQPPQPRAPA